MISWSGTSTWSPDRGNARSPQESLDTPKPPRIGVVVTSAHDVAALRVALRNVAACCSAAGAELIAVSAKSAADLGDVIREFPTARYISAPLGARVSELRHIGLVGTSANVVAFVEDFATERHGWIVQLCAGWGKWVGAGTRVGSQACEIVGPLSRPQLSVVMPVHNGGPALVSALETVMLSDLPRDAWELVVVDDASTDGTDAVAAQYADRLVRLPGRAHGPGYARNRGFEVTLGEYVTFINADVTTRPNTLRRSLTALIDSTEVGAVFGCYDTQPTHLGLVSQYRNLRQHYAVRSNGGEAQTFSSTCGTIRSDVFEQSGGYDEWHFPRRQLEDLELGQRILRLGHRILAQPEIHATHLKRWTLSGMIATEIFDRSMPWMRLVNRYVVPSRAQRRSLRSIKKLNTLVSWLGVAMAISAWWWRLPTLAIGAAICLTTVVVNNAAQLSFFYRERGLAFAAATIPLDVLSYLAVGLGTALGWITQQIVGEPRPGPTAEAFAEMGVKRWPPVPVKRVVDDVSPAAQPHAPADIVPLADASPIAARVNALLDASSPPPPSSSLLQ